MPVALRFYQTESGRRPAEEWLDALDASARIIVDARLARVRSGLMGSTRSLGDGVHELKLDFGPGYRIYFARTAEIVILLLAAGEKKSHRRDIIRAKEYRRDYLRRPR